ncbi:Asp/Glu/hydantoin racemase [Peziza echinospora]|nr:Asp/Glu/hydantoin racemase [Peziza echinospora]
MAKQKIRILIINPNSTERMTNALIPLISSLDLDNLSIDYFTAPPPSPPSINDTETAILSAKYTLPHIIPKIAEYDGFLVACYSDHPLVPQLRGEIAAYEEEESRSERRKKIVIGIFEASVLHALALVDNSGRGGKSESTGSPNRWGIVTTGKIWEELLTSGVERILDVDLKGERAGGKFAGVSSTGLTATELHDIPKEEVDRRMREATVRLLSAGKEEGRGRVTVVCLGCAGMVGLEEVVREAAREGGYKEGEVVVVDGVRAGVLVLEGLLRAGY